MHVNFHFLATFVFKNAAKLRTSTDSLFTVSSLLIQFEHFCIVSFFLTVAIKRNLYLNELC